MAVDSPNKRRSADEWPAATIGPVPDGTIDAVDRRHANGIYIGLEEAILGLTTQPTDFVDLYTMVRNHAKQPDTVDVVNKIRRLVNMALQDVAIQQNWPWFEERAVLDTHAPYTDGTVSIALATRTTVTGLVTLWNTPVTGMGFNNARAGGKLMFAGDTQPYTVSAVGSNTAITLTDRYVGTTALTDAAYTYFEDEYALAADFFRLVDAREFSDEWRLPVLRRQEFYQAYPRNTRTGKPTACTIVDLAPVGSTAPQPRIIFAPAPDKIYQIPYRCLLPRGV